MSKSFQLISEKFSQKDNELQSVYSLNFPFFNDQWINLITIIDHWKKEKGRETITSLTN